MAIRIVDQYPGKTAGANSEYPQGQARNISVPGDGTGTPWEAAIVNDDQGFKQALLREAGVIPSGNPDTAINSQYLDAMKALFMSSGALTATLGNSGEVVIPVLIAGGVKRNFRIKWGSRDYTSYPGEIQVDINFPTAFPSACYGVLMQRKMSAHGERGDGAAQLISQTRTGFRTSLQSFDDSFATSLRGFFWVAIGV